MNSKRSISSVNWVMRGGALFLALMVSVFSLTVGGILKRAQLKPASEDGAMVFLLLGTDNREEGQQGRTDAIMLVGVDPQDDKIALVSVQRDLLLAIPGHEQNRINAAYRFGGEELLRRTIEENLGITVDGSIEVDFSAFQSIISALGGVTIDNLSEAEAAYLRGDEKGGNYVNGKAGRYTNGRTYPDAQAGACLLSPEEALDFVRARHVDNTSDYGRTNRQKRLIKAILTKLKDSSTKELLALLKAGRKLLANGDLQSSASWEQLAGLGARAVDIYSRKSHEEKEAADKDDTIPQWFFQESFPQKGDFVDTTYKKMAVIAPKDPQQAVESLHRTLYGEK